MARIESTVPDATTYRSPTGAAGIRTVRPGDTLSAIARDAGVALDELIRANPQIRNPDLIHPGQAVNLPSPSATAPASPDAPTAPAPRAPRRAVRPNADGTMPRGGTSKAQPQGSVDPQRLQAAAAPSPSASTSTLSGPDRIIDMTARTEGGGRYDAWNPNDNGHGVSFGLIQFNQKSGTLPTLMRNMHAANPQKFNDTFGPHAANLRDEGYVRGADLNDPDIKRRMLQAGADPQFQQVQRDLARTGYYDPAARLAERHGLRSERAVAMLFDSSVQNGVGGTERYLRDAAAAGGSEREILTRFAERADANRWSGNRRTNLLNSPHLSDGPVGSAPAAPAPTPDAPASDSRYVVQPGDTLGGIAARHGTSWPELARINNLANPNRIHPGQVLQLGGAAAPSAPTPPAPAGGTYTVRSGDTLGGIATRHGTSWPELARLNNLANPNLIHPGQVLRLSAGGSAPPVANGTPAPVDAPAITPGRYDGRTPASGTTSQRAWTPVDAPATNGAGNRSASNYAQVLNQFAVGNNPRYAPRDGNTYCNIFTWDATRAMGAEIPHWVDGNGNSVGVGQGRELDANATNSWLHQHGARHGWRRVGGEEAQRLANDGHPAVASWRNPGGIGHIAMVRPGELTGRGPAIAQAGARNFNEGHVMDSFGSRPVEYWVHD